MTKDLEDRLDVIEKELSWTKIPKKTVSKKYYYLAGSIILMLLTLGATLKVSTHKPSQKTPDLIPTHIRAAVSFPIYYPDPAKLPRGYSFDMKTLSASNQAVVYAVNYSGRKTLVFSLQQKPSEHDIESFYQVSMPLRHDIDTQNGKAALGVVNEQTVVSLPTKEETWLLITAPLDVNQDELKKVVYSLTK